MKRIKYALQLFIYGLKNPLYFQIGVFEMIGQLFNMLKESQESGKPMRCKMVIHAEEVMSLWCSTGGLTPEKRIDQLIEENEKLREEIKMLIEDK